MKVFCAAFVCLQFGFVIFRQKDFGAKAAHKMLVKWTQGGTKTQQRPVISTEENQPKTERWIAAPIPAKSWALLLFVKNVVVKKRNNLYLGRPPSE